MGRCFAAGVYRNAVRATILVWKDHGDEELDKQLGDMMSLLATRTVIPWLRQHPERSRRRVYVVPVPSSPTSLRKRGRLHTWCLAKSVARQLRLSGVDAVAMNALRIRRGAVKSVQTSGIRGRLKRAEGLVYSPHPDRLLHRHVVVVDDIVTSGATLRQSVLVLTQAHAYPVTALLLASAVPKQRSTGDLCLHHVCLHHHA
jgi:predicted amidophosphoribosyltransferase